MFQFDYSKLKGRIVEIFGTQDAFAKFIDTNSQKVSLTLQSKRMLTQGEISCWAKALGIPVEDYGLFFFTLKIHEREL